MSPAEEVTRREAAAVSTARAVEWLEEQKHTLVGGDLVTHNGQSE